LRCLRINTYPFNPLLDRFRSPSMAIPGSEHMTGARRVLHSGIASRGQLQKDTTRIKYDRRPGRCPVGAACLA